MTFAQPFTDYEILDRVGAGAMGTVFKARHKKLSRIVALKVLKPSLARDSRYVDRLRREARIVASLNHPNIVTGYDLGEEGGYHFFVMEFVEGKPLRALLAEWGMFAEEYVVDIGIQIAVALDHAYQRGVIHRDIKPGNVLIDEDGDVKLSDMGLAKGPTDLTLTRDGATVGTPQYISPEQARNPQDVDVRTDLYSLGATLYHMATGVPPFTGETMAELIGKVIYDPPVPPIEINPALSEGLSLVLRKLLAKDLRVRYQTPRELLDDLHRVKKAQPPQVDTARLAAGEGERRSRLSMRLLFVAAAVVVIGAGVWFGTRLPRDPVEVAATDPFLARLDEELQGMETPGERWDYLGRLLQGSPASVGAELTRRQNRVFHDLQQAVDAAAAEFTGDGWREFVRWVEDPAEWPSREACIRERVTPTLLGKTGLDPSQFPLTLDLARVNELRRSIDALVAQRSRALLTRLGEFLGTTLPDRAARMLATGNYVGAEKAWAEALASFCTGVGEPRVDRLAEATLRSARALCENEAANARVAIQRAESLRAEAMGDEVRSVIAHFARQLADGQDPAVIAAAVARYRQDQLQLWPVVSNFHPELDPWKEAEAQLAGIHQQVRLAIDAAERRRFEQRCDFAWRTLCFGEARDALAVLDGVVAPTEALEGRLAQHREVLRSAAAVHDQVLAALARHGDAVSAFPRAGSGLLVRVYAESDGGVPELFCQEGDEVRRAAVGEFLFSRLLANLKQAIGSNPLAGLPDEDRRRGQLVFQLVGDELMGLRALLVGLEDEFLTNDVANRILSVRDERPEVVLDRAGLIDRVAEELVRARSGGNPAALELAIASFETSVPGPERSDQEWSVLREARAFRRLARRSARIQEDIESEVQGRGMAVEVSPNAARKEVLAELRARPEQLIEDASAGWELRDGVLEFAGGDRPWSELDQSRIVLRTGMPPSGKTSLRVDLTLPSAKVGSRYYVFTFRGVAVMLVVTADDAVHAALVQGDLRDRANADRAFDQAVAGVFDAVKVHCVPGGEHTLAIDVHPTRGGSYADVRVSFQGRELLRGKPMIDAEAPATMAIFPRQELRVHRVAVDWAGS